MPPSTIWKDQGLDVSWPTWFYDRGRTLLRGGGPPAAQDAATIAATVFMVALVLLWVLRPPFVMRKPCSDFHVPTVSPLLVVAWATAAAGVAVGLRYVHN